MKLRRLFSGFIVVAFVGVVVTPLSGAGHDDGNGRDNQREGQRLFELQAEGAILDHAQAPAFPKLAELEAIRQFQLTDAFFSSPEVRNVALGGPRPRLPRGPPTTSTGS